MKLKWKGILSKTNPFPSPAIPAEAEDLFKGHKNWQVYMLIVPILLGAYLCIKLKRSFATEVVFTMGALLLGVGLSLLFLSVHELIHAMCCPKKLEILVYVTFAEKVKRIELTIGFKSVKNSHATSGHTPNKTVGMMVITIYLFFLIGEVGMRHRPTKCTILSEDVKRQAVAPQGAAACLFSLPHLTIPSFRGRIRT